MRPSLPYLGTQFKNTEQVFALNNVSLTQVLPSNPNRYAVIFSTISGGQINLCRNPQIGVNGSLTLANAANASLQNIVLTFADVGSIVQDTWFAASKGAAETLGVNESMYVPTGSVPE
jgi:hypothetical protein